MTSERPTAIVARWAQDAGADFFDVSTGGLVAHARIPVGPGYQAHLAEYVGDRADVPVSAVGRITMPEQAERLVADGEVDAVMFGKAMMRDPHFALRAAYELGADTSSSGIGATSAMCGWTRYTSAASARRRWLR